MRGAARGSRCEGSVTAEFAVVVPAVILVLGLCLAALQVAGLQVRLQDAAAIAARSLGRNDEVPGLSPGLARATLVSSQRGPLICARLALPVSGPLGDLLGIDLKAESCALSEVTGE